MTRLLRLAAVAALVALAPVALAGCGTDERPSVIATGAPASPGVGGAAQQEGLPSPPPPVPPNPLAGKVLYVDPVNPANQQAATWTTENRTADAQQIRKIGDRAVAHWLTAGTDASKEVDALVTRAAAAGRLPVLVAYNIPGRDCGSFSAGGAASPTAYRAWIRTVVAGLRGRSAVVIVEPDAVPHAVDGCEGREDERFALLRDAVTTLKSSANALVYLDAGHPAWVADVSKLAGALRRAGVDTADGVSLNVSNFIPTAANFAYGDRLSAALGGKRFVIDTSRNGAGPAAGTEVGGGPSWCNPPGRRLGEPPTVDTGHPRAAALLWIKRPGESDGACRDGEPAAGKWWPEYALDLARRS
jgi:endoglucanase